MKSKKTLSAILLTLITIVCLITAQVVTVGAETETSAQSIYDANKEIVAAIDEGNNFAKLRDLANEDEQYIAQMQAVVEVATAYDEFASSYTEDEYNAADWTKIAEEVDMVKSVVKLTSGNYATYADSVAKNLDRIEKGKTYIGAKFVSYTAAYAAHKVAAKEKVDAKYADLLSVNATHPTANVYDYYGIYDNAGVNEMQNIKATFENDLDALTLDKADYNGSVNAVKELRAKAEADLAAVRRNDVERTYDDLNDYYAVVNGDKAGNASAMKENLKTAIAKLNNSFWNRASDEVLKKYSNEKKSFDKFVTETEIDDSEYRDRSYIEDANGVVRIEAYNEDGDLVEVIPAKAILKVNHVADAAAMRRNADTAVAAKASGVTVA